MANRSIYRAAASRFCRGYHPWKNVRNCDQNGETWSHFTEHGIPASGCSVGQCFQFLPCNAMQMRPMSTCGVHLSRSWILSKWINISSKFFRCLVPKPFKFFHTKQHGNITIGTALMRHQMHVEYAKIAMLSLYLASLCAVNAATSQMLSTRHCRTIVPQVVTLIAGSKWQSLLMAGDDN